MIQTVKLIPILPSVFLFHAPAVSSLNSGRFVWPKFASNSKL